MNFMGAQYNPYATMDPRVQYPGAGMYDPLWQYYRPPPYAPPKHPAISASATDSALSRAVVNVPDNLIQVALVIRRLNRL